MGREGSTVSSPAASKGNREEEEEGKKEEEEEKKGKTARGKEVEEEDSSSDDAFSDVVVVDPLGVEEEKPVVVKSAGNSPKRSPDEQEEKAALKHEEAKQMVDQPPTVKYPNLGGGGQQQEQHQSWFSSAQLPTFLQSDDGDGSQGAAPSSPSASALHLLGQLRARLQPWADFFRPAKFGLPPGLVAIGPRVKHNLRHFLSNYLCLFIVLLIYCILTSLLMLLTLIVLAGLCYTIYQHTQKGPVIVGGHEIPPSLLYTVALMVCIPLFYLANAGSVMYWVIGTGLFLMLAHAIFYASEEVPGQEFEVVTVVTA